MAAQPNRLIKDEATLLERRAGVRTRTVYRSAKIVSGRDAGLCWILNLSDGGAMVETGLAVVAGEEIWIELADGIVIAGSVAWRDRERVGMSFSQPIDSFQLLRQLAQERWNGRSRQVRLQVNKLVEVASELGPSILRLQDVSQRGLQLRHIGNLGVGMPVTIHLSQELVVRGVVRWKRDSVAGVELDGMIPVCALLSRTAFEND